MKGQFCSAHSSSYSSCQQSQVTSDPDIGGLESVSDVETPVTHKKLDFKDLSLSNRVELKSTIQTTKDSRRTK